MRKLFEKLKGKTQEKQVEKNPVPDRFPSDETLSRIRDFSYHFADMNFGDIFSEKLLHQVGDILFQYWCLSQSIHWVDLSIKETGAGDMSVIDGDLREIAVLFEQLSNHISNPENSKLEGYSYKKKPYQGH